MRAKELKYLEDILMAINEIDTFLHGPKNFKEYQKNKILRRAVERNLEIIGEATRRLERTKTDIKIENSKKIISLRNIITHDYAAVIDELIWAIVVNHLPKLKKEIKKLIKEKDKEANKLKK